MKKLLSVLLVSILLIGCSENRVLIDQLIVKGRELNNDGLLTIYDEGDLFTGIGFDVDSDGILKMETDIKDGKIKNVLEYYSNGQLRSEENWIDGKKYMIERGWYENGQLRYEYNSKDIKDELSVRTNSGGFGRKMFKDGTQRDWNENGQLMYEGNWKDGKEDGLSKWWYDHGQLSNEENYIDGKKDGTQREWYENGQLRYEGNWKDGKEDGLSKWWYDHGQLINEQNYIDGKKDGLSLIERILL